MKKIVLAFAALLMVTALAISCGNKSGKKAAEGEAAPAVESVETAASAASSDELNYAKALSLVKQAIAAAKAGNVSEYCRATAATIEFSNSLTEEQNDYISERLDSDYTEEDEEILANFGEAHMDEVLQYLKDNGLMEDDEE